jgi:hypothetical protein
MLTANLPAKITCDRSMQQTRHPHVGAFGGVVVPPRQVRLERLVEHLPEVPGLADRQVLDQSLVPVRVSGLRTS